MQSLNYYYYYYGVQCLSIEASKTVEHSSRFGSCTLGCLNYVSILVYLRVNYLFKLTCSIPISNFIRPYMQQIFLSLDVLYDGLDCAWLLCTACIAFFIGKQRDISASMNCGLNAHVLHIRVIKGGRIA